MTRKDALLFAINKLGEIPEYAEVIEKLNGIIEDIPLNHWSRESILDACEQFLKDHHTDILTVTDFDRDSKLPSHIAIEQHFHMSAKEFRDTYFPLQQRLHTNKSKDAWLRYFIREYRRIKPISGIEYNQKRVKTSPTWRTIAAYHGLETWGELLSKCRVTIYEGPDKIRMNPCYITRTFTDSGHK